jgi:hypothetical protein
MRVAAVDEAFRSFTFRYEQNVVSAFGAAPPTGPGTTVNRLIIGLASALPSPLPSHKPGARFIPTRPAPANWLRRR